MQFMQLHFQKIFLTFLVIFCSINEPSRAKPAISTTIVVDLKGTGSFESVQKAIDSIPPNPTSWTLIHVKAGIYNEKVTIPKEKPFIVLEGEGSRYTIIEFGDHGDASTSTTFIAMAENFVARYISFRRCVINVTTMDQGPGSTGFIAAQGRDSATNPSGYVFKYCRITGNNKGRVFLGRAYGQFSRVIYYKTFMTDIIKPEGWSAWDKEAHTADISFSEVGCFGGGSNMSQRAKWEKVLSPNELKYFTSKEFINSDGWIENQP